MNKETVVSKLHDVMLNRVSKKIENGESDFTAYPILGKFAVGLLVGLGEKSNSFYDGVNQDIVAKFDSEVYALRGDMGSGETDSSNRVRTVTDNPSPIRLGGYEKVVIRAASPRTQSE